MRCNWWEALLECGTKVLLVALEGGYSIISWTRGKLLLECGVIRGRLLLE